MSFHSIPPQAYTKEDIAKAYLWVQAQPDYVKNMATSKETLVALYLQAKRNGVASLEALAPISSKNFKSQLQTLAGELSQFEIEKGPKAHKIPLGHAPSQPPRSPAQTPPPQAIQINISSQAQEQIPHSEPDIENPFQSPIEHAPLIKEPQSKTHFLEEAPLHHEDLGARHTLDSRSQEILEEIKLRLNMESEKDILRMLIILGYEKIKSLFPNK